MVVDVRSFEFGRSEGHGGFDDGVGALDPAAHGTLVDHLDQTTTLELAEVAVQGRLGDVAEVLLDLEWTHRPTGQGLDDAESHRVE